MLSTCSPPRTVGALSSPRDIWGRVLGVCVCTHVLRCAQTTYSRPFALPQADLISCRALTFLPSALYPSFPDGGSVDTVKSFGSSQSRIFDSFIRESSFLLAMFSTRFRLVATCQSPWANPCHQSPGLWWPHTPAGARDPRPRLGFSHLALAACSLLHGAAYPHATLLQGCMADMTCPPGP